MTKIVADYFRALDSARVCSEASPSEMEKIFDEPLPTQGVSTEEILHRFTVAVVPHAMNIPRPTLLRIVQPDSAPAGRVSDALAAAINQNGAAWRNSPSASVIEARGCAGCAI